MDILQKAVENPIIEKMGIRSRRRLIVFIAIITLLSMISSTIAWFAINSFVGVDTLDLHITVATQLKVAMNDYGTNLDRYSKVIRNEMVDEFLAVDNTKLADIVLDPVTTSDGVRMVSKSGIQRERNKSSFLEFDCWFIATEDMWVHLTTEDAADQPNSGTMVTSASPAPQNDIVNCARVSFTTDSNGTTTFENHKGETINGLSTFDLPSGAMVYSDNTRLFHLDEMTPTKVTIRLWIDGEDPACNDNVQQADLRVQMSFLGTDDNNDPIS